MKWLFPALLLAGSLAALPAQEPKEQAAEEAHGKGEKDMLGWKWANFVVLVAGLGYLAIKVGGPFFEARTAGIRKELDEAEKARQEAGARVAEVNAKIANLGIEIGQLKAALHAEQERHADLLRKEAAAELARIQVQGEQQIDALAKASRQELKVYSAELAIGLAEQKIRAQLTPDVEERFSQAFFEKLRA
jgi:F-type H+-transporting ATPase subunit b